MSSHTALHGHDGHSGHAEAAPDEWVAGVCGGHVDLYSPQAVSSTWRNSTNYAQDAQPDVLFHVRFDDDSHRAAIGV